MAMVCVLTGCHPDNPLETTRQMTLTAESDLSRDGSERLALTNESLCVANSDAFQIGVRRHSDISPKCPQEIVRTERDLRCKLSERDGLWKTILDVVACPLDRFLFPTERHLRKLEIGMATDERGQREGEVCFRFKTGCFPGQDSVQGQNAASSPWVIDTHFGKEG